MLGSQEVVGLSLFLRLSSPLPPLFRAPIPVGPNGSREVAQVQPGRLAARLRAALDSAPLTTVSLPLDIGDRSRTLHTHSPPPRQAA
jgi:hypothetical protein